MQNVPRDEDCCLDADSPAGRLGLLPAAGLPPVLPQSQDRLHKLPASQFYRLRQCDHLLKRQPGGWKVLLGQHCQPEQRGDEEADEELGGDHSQDATNQ